MIKEIQGDLLDTDCSVIGHGVNCQGVMGSGVAKAIYTKHPVVRLNYISFFQDHNAGLDGENFLGEIDYISVYDKPFNKITTIVNCFTQQYYGHDGGVYVSYEAVKKCMEKLRDLCLNEYRVNEVAMPKIGCGLAGGSWKVVSDIINEVFPQEFIVKVYYL